MNTPESELTMHIEGLDCANCAMTLERSIAQLEGIEQVQVSFTNATLQAAGAPDREAIARRVEALGYRVVSQPPTQAPASDARAISPAGLWGGIATFLRYLWQDRSTAVALVATAVLVASAPLALLPVRLPLGGALTALHVLAVLLVGYPITAQGVRSLVRGHQITIDLLMTIAALGALLIGETGEAATVVVLFAIGEALEGYSADRARDSLRSLLALRPNEATVVRPCVDCQEHLGREGYEGGPCPLCVPHEITVPVEQVQVGEVVIVRPADQVPVDGWVTSGTSAVNQAPITGESIPVTKSVGDTVFAGSINGQAVLEVKASRPASDSTIGRIVRLVQEAQAQRSPVERFIDRFARWYTPATVVVALAVAVLPPLIFGAPFLDAQDGTHGWLYRALSLLIVACPCALVISTPVTVVSAMTALARRGVLVKGGAFLDVLARVKTFALDKTGTLTRGEPRIVGTRTAQCSPLCASAPMGTLECAACDDMLALASSVERRSEHPLARAILAEAESRSLLQRYPSAQSVQALAGQGVVGSLDCSMVTVGNHALFHQQPVDCTLHDQVEAAERAGQTVMLVGRDDRLLGFMTAADTPREASREAVRALKQLDPQVRLVMLTGDSPAVATAIAGQIGGVDEVRAGLLPADKLQAIRDLQAQGGPVAMIGDGVNDAPALAAADVSIAMGAAGTAQAMETADLVLMQDNLRRLPEAVKTSQRAHRAIRQNILFSLLVKGVILALAVAGLGSLWMAVFADVGASLLVTLNGMRLLRARQ